MLLMDKLNKNSPAKYSVEDIKDCISLLDYLTKNSDQLLLLSEEQRISLMTAAGQLSRPDRYEIRKRRRDIRKMKRQAVVKEERRARGYRYPRRA